MVTEEKKNAQFEALILQKGGNKAAIGKRLGGISSQRIGQYVLGRMKPKEDFFRAWEKAYGENIRNLFDTNVSSGEEETLFIPRKMEERGLQEPAESYGSPDRKAIFDLVQSNRVLSEANKTLADAHFILAKGNEELILMLKHTLGLRSAEVEDSLPNPGTPGTLPITKKQEEKKH